MREMDELVIAIFVEAGVKTKQVSGLPWWIARRVRSVCERAKHF